MPVSYKIKGSKDAKTDALYMKILQSHPKKKHLKGYQIRIGNTTSRCHFLAAQGGVFKEKSLKQEKN